MVYINLKEKSRQLNWIPVLLPVFGIAVALLVFPITKYEEPTLRPLDVEEQETVLSAISRLQMKSPRLSQWAETVKGLVIHSKIPVFVDEGANKDNGGQLIMYMGASIIFVPGFFDADTSIQEQALSQIIVAVAPGLSPAEELVVVDE
ncbi:MAG: hypothetical protein HY537_15960 [Deltaproteobacteria bacterium]|nr:hypothetical protein [Deltaproteobacteria bacterium]